MNVRDASEIERAITEFSRAPNAGLIVTGSALVVTHRDLVVTLAQRHGVPAVYYERVHSRLLVVSCPMDLMSLTSTGKRPAT